MLKVGVYDSFETFLLNFLGNINNLIGERAENVQDIHDYDHDAYVVVQPE